MSKEEYLRGLEEALAGEVPASVIRENMNYYNSYLSQEMAKGRTVDEISEEIGEPRIVARTIIDSCEASGEAFGTDGNPYGTDGEGAYESSFDRNSYGGNTSPQIHYFNLNKWYWKLLLILMALAVGSLVLNIVGGIFTLLIRFAGPILIIFLVLWFFRNIRD